MKSVRFGLLLLCLFYCSTTLASSSSDSERTLSDPSSPVRQSSPVTSPTTLSSAPSLSRFVRLDDLVQRPSRPSATPAATVPRIYFPKKTPKKQDPNSLSARLESSRAYWRQMQLAKAPLPRPGPSDKEAARQRAINVYLGKKHRRLAAGAPVRTGVPVNRFPLTSGGHPIFGPQPYRPRNSSGQFQAKSKGARRGDDADRDWTPARERAQAKKNKAKAEQKAKNNAMREGKEKATYKEKGKGKAESEAEPRPKMRKLINLG